jgi:hypothetical protein
VVLMRDSHFQSVDARRLIREFIAHIGSVTPGSSQ